MFSGYHKFARCVYNESIVWRPQGSCSYFSCSFQQVQLWMVFTGFLIQNIINNIKNLYLRCVLNWFGDWSTGALYQVGKEFTSKLDLDKSMVTINFFFCYVNFVDKVLFYLIYLTLYLLFYSILLHHTYQLYMKNYHYHQHIVKLLSMHLYLYIKLYMKLTQD